MSRYPRSGQSLLHLCCPFRGTRCSSDVCQTLFLVVSSRYCSRFRRQCPGILLSLVRVILLLHMFVDNLTHRSLILCQLKRWVVLVNELHQVIIAWRSLYHDVRELPGRNFLSQVCKFVRESTYVREVDVQVRPRHLFRAGQSASSLSTCLGHSLPLVRLPEGFPHCSTVSLLAVTQLKLEKDSSCCTDGV